MCLLECRLGGGREPGSMDGGKVTLVVGLGLEHCKLETTLL